MEEKRTLKTLGFEYLVDFKNEILGIMAPILITLIFQSLSAGLSFVFFSVLFLFKNGKSEDAKQVLCFALSTVSIAILLLIATI